MIDAKLKLGLCAWAWMAGQSVAIAAEQPISIHAEDDKPIISKVERLLLLASEGDTTTISKEDLLGGELLGAKFNRGLDGSQTVDKVIKIKTDKAVARRADNPDRPNDYFYLTKVGVEWQIHSIRTLALPGFVWELKRNLAETPARATENEAIYQNLLLITQPDGELKKWFINHKPQLDEMRVLKPVFKEFSQDGSSSRRLSNIARVNYLVGMMFLNYAEMEDSMFNVSLGGVLDNSVGFLHAHSDNVPEISPSEYIWIEPMGDDWYFYRTT
jgi:hypothetical protein